jgi:hypothetical protein
MAEIKKVWVVTDPTPDSGIVDILFEATPRKLADYIRGSRTTDWESESTKLYDDKASATADANKRLKDRDQRREAALAWKV